MKVIANKSILHNNVTNCTFLASELDEQVQTGTRENDSHIEWMGDLTIPVGSKPQSIHQCQNFQEATEMYAGRRSSLSSAGKQVKTARQIALDKVDAEYYDKSSNHYRDNERYSWAVKSINQTFDEEEAQFKSSTASTDTKNLSGEFEVIDGKLSFTCHTSNIPYSEVLQGITLLSDELNRQINQQTNCPHYEAPASTVKVVSLDHDILISQGFEEVGNSYFHPKMSGLYLSRPYKEAKHYLVKSNGQDKLTSVTSVEDLSLLYRAITGEWYRKQLTGE